MINNKSVISQQQPGTDIGFGMAFRKEIKRVYKDNNVASPVNDIINATDFFKKNAGNKIKLIGEAPPDGNGKGKNYFYKTLNFQAVGKNVFINKIVERMESIRMDKRLKSHIKGPQNNIKEPKSLSIKTRFDKIVNIKKLVNKLKKITQL